MIGAIVYALAGICLFALLVLSVMVCDRCRRRRQADEIIVEVLNGAVIVEVLNDVGDEVDGEVFSQQIVDEVEDFVRRTARWN
ncbi:MAG: hypothetical protein H0T76_06290 [Nannocystis sp.]|nr:hypothetical protein [Nannocystis sp.]MBA3546071.1 hypothetical protein [Nannocystis sp.]